MPTVGQVPGKDMFLYVEKSGEFVLVGCSTSSSLSVNADMLEAACKSSAGWNEGKPGQKSWEGSIEGVHTIYTGDEIADNLSSIELFDAIVNSTRLALRFGTALTGDTQLAGNAYVTSWEASAPADGFTTYSVTFTGTGPITKVTVPAP